jgi:HSP20 family protein
MNENRPLVVPIVTIDHDRDRYMIQVELPGVRKEDINVEVTESSFCVHAENDNAVIAGCYFLAHPVNIEEADAAYDGSLLNFEIPFKTPIKGRTVEVREGTMDFAQENPRKIEMKNGFGSGTQ